MAEAPPASADSRGKFFVPTGKRTGFGAFREGPDSPARLRQPFGSPHREQIDNHGFTCTFGWPELGIAAELVAFGSASEPCSEGTFVEARLTDPRWHTASGVNPGDLRRVARKAALRKCNRRTIGCGITGYALELHHTVCSTDLSAGVIAHTRGHRVVSLIVRWRGCE